MRLDHAKSQQGIALVEVLVAVLIFSIGLLGIASLQTTGLRMTRDAGLMMQMAEANVTMMNRMRANQLAEGEAPPENLISVGANNGCDASDVACSYADQASHNIYLWEQDMAKIVPGSTVSMSSADGIETLTVTWSASHDGGTQTMTMEMIP